jgi:hypothetical protein
MNLNIKNKATMKNYFLAILVCLASCSFSPKLDPAKIRAWETKLDSEYPDRKVVIAHYKKNDVELSYLAARHTNEVGSDTFKMVELLFEKQPFNVLLIESIPHSSGESPQWFLDEAMKGQGPRYVKGGESAFGTIKSHKRGIPFYSGEPDHLDIYQSLKAAGYSDHDVLGFYVVRQIPQWVRENVPKKSLLESKIPPFLNYYCQIFKMQVCPNRADIELWYKNHSGHDLSIHVLNKEVAPLADGKLHTQKISTQIGVVRDRFTLSVIESLLKRYKKVAVIYGASHFVTLRKSFDSSLGAPTFIEH